ncbi:carbohydrate kinase family protein [Arthrobacter glacialis]|uniref:carbohydrate kinase family protein n=1 Tax=Arthrobacter glacialis TaxID=1664 RepID=UPI000CD4209E|nr:carbohydrate kinase [Arthrobacter glacialis]POH59355.1 carbohydrate kinase [Arthrobacter glacialis]
MLTVIGEALIDEVVRPGKDPLPHVGGSPMNVAVGLARLGHPVQFLGRYGHDAYGDMVGGYLRTNSVMVPLAPDAQPTSVARAVLDDAGAASYEFALDWSLPELTSTDGAPNFMLGATTLLHTGSIATMLSPGAKQVLAAVTALHPLATIAFDPNCRPSIITDVDYARVQAEKFVRMADVVKASDEDLAWLYPGVDPKESARAWLAIGGTQGPAIVVLTQGGDGPWAVCAAGEAACPVPDVQVVDTVGAGDSFMAALLSTLVDRELDGAQRRGDLRGISTATLAEMIGYAARAAAITVSRAGANPPSRDELQK